MPDVLVTEDIRGAALENLKADFDVLIQPDLWQRPGDLEEILPDFRAIMVRNQTKVTAELIAACPRLEIIGRNGVGLDNVDCQAATKAGIVVAYAPEQNAISVAELTLGMMLGLARRILPADRSTKAGAWERASFVGAELYGKTLGVIGLGRIGFRVALRARAFGMHIIAYDEYANPDGITISELQAEMITLDELLARADFISCHLPLTDETRAMMDYKRFSQMKPTAYFINAARGEVVDEAGLVSALEEGKLAGAGLDVRQQEPPEKNALCEMDNVILTPHIAAFTEEGQGRVVASVCKDIAAVLSGGGATNFFNFPRPKQ